MLDFLTGCGWDFLMATWKVWLPVGLVVVGFMLIFMYDNLVGGLICIASGGIIGLYLWQRATRHDV